MSMGTSAYMSPEQTAGSEYRGALMVSRTLAGLTRAVAIPCPTESTAHAHRAPRAGGGKIDLPEIKPIILVERCHTYSTTPTGFAIPYDSPRWPYSCGDPIGS